MSCGARSTASRSRCPVSSPMPTAIALCLALAAGPLFAQQAAVELLTDVELWETDAGSRLLARNDGELGGLGRVYGWGVVRLASTVEVVALGQVVGGTATTTDEDFEASLEQIAVRFFPSRQLLIEAGRVLLPLGEFAIRRFSHLNPLVGAPDAYSTLYPWGVTLSGVIGALDWRAALVSLPAIDEDYVPEPGHAMRPVVGIGVRRGAAFHAGLTATVGPYLGPDVSGAVPPGAEWGDYGEKVLTLDARYSLGYVETRAEVTWSSYEVPTVADPVDGFAWYAEARVTLSPRVFVAGRFERNRYAFIRPAGTGWISTDRTQMNGEVGFGYRLGPETLIKASYRRDYWPGETLPGAPAFPDGYAIALQFCYWFDVASALAGRE